VAPPQGQLLAARAQLPALEGRQRPLRLRHARRHGQGAAQRVQRHERPRPELRHGLRGQDVRLPALLRGAARRRDAALPRARARQRPGEWLRLPHPWSVQAA
jgi:hypothetical protein